MTVSSWTLFGQTVGLLLFLAIYALPSIIALARRHPKRWPIVAVNLIGGLFGGIGWVIAMVWCFIDDGRGGNRQIDQLERLEGMLQRGSLSRDEFEQQKRALLRSTDAA
jgi:hypothetical protein